jgi:two-component system, NarL family, response regulator LiaR
VRPIRVLIADDHPPTRADMRAAVELDPRFVVCAEVSDGAAAVEAALRERPDICLLDIRMPGSGIAATREITTRLPATRVVMITVSLDDDDLFNALRAGAMGYLLKDTQADDLRTAIKAAAAGQVQLSPQAAARLLREVRAPESPEALTEREADVLKLLARGKANKEIARTLAIGDQTVKSHVGHILAKLGVQSRTQAALHAVRIGLVPADATERSG